MCNGLLDYGVQCICYRFWGLVELLRQRAGEQGQAVGSMLSADRGAMNNIVGSGNGHSATSAYPVVSNTGQALSK